MIKMFQENAPRKDNFITERITKQIIHFLVLYPIYKMTIQFSFQFSIHDY